MRQIRRQLEREQHVVECQVIANVLTQRRIKRQLQQAAVVFRQFEFTRRAQHALAFYTPQLTDFDEERFAIFTGWQFSPHHGTRHLDANPGIGRTANDVQQSTLPHIDLAHLQLVGVGMLGSGLDFTDDDFCERRRDRFQLFYLQPSHC